MARKVRAGHVQCDEICSLAHAGRPGVPEIRGHPDWAGEVWNWMAIEADNRLIVSFAVGNRGRWAATMFMGDLFSRLSMLDQLSTDGCRPYLDAIASASGRSTSPCSSRTSGVRRSRSRGGLALSRGPQG